MAKLNEQFLKMQKLAGIITEEQYSEKINEVSISGIVSKFKDKVMNFPPFQKFIDTVVSKMTDEDIAKFKSKFNIAEAEGVPSLEDIMKKAVALNPDSDNTEPITEEIDRESVVGKIINLVRVLSNVNLVTAGALLGVPLSILLAGALAPLAATAGVLISFIASCIVSAIANKLLERGDDESIFENQNNIPEDIEEYLQMMISDFSEGNDNIYPAGKKMKFSHEEMEHGDADNYGEEGAAAFFKTRDFLKNNGPVSISDGEPNVDYTFSTQGKNINMNWIEPDYDY